MVKKKNHNHCLMVQENMNNIATCLNADFYEFCNKNKSNLDISCTKMNKNDAFYFYFCIFRVTLGKVHLAEMCIGCFYSP